LRPFELVVGQFTAFEDRDTRVVVSELLHGDRPIGGLFVAKLTDSAMAPARSVTTWTQTATEPST
jgi:hypothetical protein